MNQGNREPLLGHELVKAITNEARDTFGHIVEAESMGVDFLSVVVSLAVLRTTENFDLMIGKVQRERLEALFSMKDPEPPN